MADKLLDDIFTIKQVDADGKRFDKVSRIKAVSEQQNLSLELDINSEIYPLHANQKFKMVLASTLNLDGTPDSGYYTQGGRQSLADEFEYVMHGKLYKISDASGTKAQVEMCISFGGLLMLLTGEPSDAQKFELDQRLFILIRKV